MRVLAALFLALSFSTPLLAQTKQQTAKPQPKAGLKSECDMALAMDVSALNSWDFNGALERLTKCVVEQGTMMTKKQLQRAFELRGELAYRMEYFDIQVTAKAAGQEKVDNDSKWSVALVEVARQHDDVVTKYNNLVGQYNGLLSSYQQHLNQDAVLYNYLNTQIPAPPTSPWRRALWNASQTLQNWTPPPPPFQLHCTTNRVGDFSYTNCY